ncbi:hypothetical protein GIB67_022916 [Kingdonia uniflora]|uniref:Uncharacterized protein n=1 Tax=Kingdonia uniflora TaxID=39325 RepID=A0A7J7P234_9MAGN|nr:hypothetical protein GIB67_022916 [Kingdonia uniflora]
MMMEKLCSGSGGDLEVDVNGQEIFFVNKGVISAFSDKLSKLFGKSAGSTRKLKVIFHDFPGGAEGFELMARFCYNNGKTEITPSNVSLLHCVGHFMEMADYVSGDINLIEQTKKSLEEISYWSWSELQVALKQCQDFLPVAESSGLIQKYLDSLVTRLVWSSDESTSTSSPESSGFRFSFDTRSTGSTKNSYVRATWWFEDIVALNPDLIERVIKAIISQKFDHVAINRFLFYYQKTRSPGATVEKKREIIEMVVNMLFLLDQSLVSCKSIFGILSVASSLNINKSSRIKLETMIGSQLDRATLDNLLVPSQPGVDFLYDVNLVLRFLKLFLLSGDSWVTSARLKKVSKLIDMYIAEVAPDPNLKPPKFVALVMALPDSARNSYDEVYRAMDMYLEVHAGLSEEEKIKICCGLNYEKLSSNTCKHLAQNSKFPPRTVILALSTQQSKLNNLLKDTNHPKPFIESPPSYTKKTNREKDIEDTGQIVLYATKLDLSAENEKLKANLQGMQWRVMELEKICRKMQIQMAKMVKSKVSSTSSSSRSLPRLCS